MKILVCDDERVVSMFVSLILEPEGCQVVTAFDGQDALEKIQADPVSFDVLITDYRMPRLNGMELIETLRAKNIRLKIMMMTGFVRQLDAMDQEPLFDKLLAKPFRAEQLLDCFHDLVR